MSRAGARASGGQASATQPAGIFQTFWKNFTKQGTMLAILLLILSVITSVLGKDHAGRRPEFSM